MPLRNRIAYALCLLIAVTMAAVVLGGVLEGFGFSPSHGLMKVAFHPLWMSVVFLAGFAVAPAIYRRVPMYGNSPRVLDQKQPFPFAVRLVALVLIAAVLSLIVSLVVMLAQHLEWL